MLAKSKTSTRYDAQLDCSHSSILIMIVLKNKKVTILHKGELLLNEAYPKSFRKDVAKSMRKRDIELVLGDHIDDLTISEAGTIQTHSGKRLIADLVVRRVLLHSYLSTV